MKKVDVDENNEAMQASGVTCMPTFMVFKNGETADKLEGAVEDELRALLDRAKQ
eukprot:CAMPEP_0170463278 /NCGR_PEP_ID=MMETSP0123-20130129/8453_1 /TAXON_ID=182087 /ORGANISM="Favella ehrenbergii, Strain Fehren 1" /LENGTH=53 /DNA_ID=CAMNT_0010728677 /DNA_START=471 /DNA_END=632 /DNA_ORIENTATION=+